MQVTLRWLDSNSTNLLPLRKWVLWNVVLMLVPTFKCSQVYFLLLDKEPEHKEAVSRPVSAAPELAVAAAEVAPVDSAFPTVVEAEADTVAVGVGRHSVELRLSLRLLAIELLELVAANLLSVAKQCLYKKD